MLNNCLLHYSKQLYLSIIKLSHFTTNRDGNVECKLGIQDVIKVCPIMYMPIAKKTLKLKHILDINDCKYMKI